MARKPISRRGRAQRGSVLLLAIVLVVVLGLLAASALSFSRSELAAARTLRGGDELLACADAGRQYLLSRFKLFAMKPAHLTLAMSSDKLTGTPCPPQAGSDERCLMAGHLGDTRTTVQGVRVAPSGGDRTVRNARDLSNVVADANSLGGADYQVVVHCMDGRGRESEVEFLVRFGL
jgi:Tfp pilus assembly protein PilX